MAATVFIAPGPFGAGYQAFDSNGKPLNAGLLSTFAAGTNTPLATYTSSAGTVQNPTVITLGSDGRAPQEIWLLSGSAYKFILTDSLSNLIGTYDGLTGVNDSAFINPVSEWIPQSAPTFISGTSFSVSGNQTAVFDVDRRVKSTNTGGTIYSTVTGSVFNAGPNTTTVTVINDSGALDSGLSAVSVGIFDPAHPSYAPTMNLVGVNRFINGDMRIDQRHAGAAQTITAAAALAYTVDRWYGYCTGANVTGQQVAGTAPNQFNYRYTGAASVTKIGHSQRIEQANSQDLAGTNVTLSVDLANSLLATVTWTAWYANSADTFGTLASPTRTQIATGTFTVSSTLSRYSTSISIPAAATTGIEVEFSVGAQISGTFTIGRAKLEAGAVATPFMLSMFGAELAACQRYFEKSYDLTVAPGAINTNGRQLITMNPVPNTGASTPGMSFNFKVTKRAPPTMTSYSDGTGVSGKVRDNTNGVDVNSNMLGIGMNSFVQNPTMNAANTAFLVSWHWTADAEL